MAAVKTFLTFEEFEQLEYSPFKQEIIHGELIELPPPEAEHDDVSHWIYHSLHTAVEQAHARGEALQLGRAYHETGYKFPGNSWLIPDVSVTHARQVKGKYKEGSPAIAIEVLWPTNTAREIAAKMKIYFECGALEAKMKIYFEFGALEVWRVNHKKRCFTIDVRDSSSVIEGDGVVTTPLIPGFSLRLADVFGA